MPPIRFALLITGVIAAVGVTLAIVDAAGLPPAAVGLAALLGSLALGWRGWTR